MEQKLAAYRYLMNRMHSLPLNTKDKNKEWNSILHIAKTNGFPCSLISKLNVQITQTISLPPSHNSTPSNPQNWVTFTFHNAMKRKIADLFKNNNIQIIYHTNNTIYGIFKTSSNNTNTYIHSGIYQLQCHTCHLLYRSNRFWHLKQRYKGHIQCITSNNPHSSHAFHILHNKMTMDTWTPPCSFSIQSTTVAKWTHEKAFEFNFFFHLFDFSTARPADTTPPLLLWYITYWQPFSKTRAIIFRFIYFSIF